MAGERVLCAVTTVVGLAAVRAAAPTDAGPPPDMAKARVVDAPLRAGGTISHPDGQSALRELTAKQPHTRRIARGRRRRCQTREEEIARKNKRRPRIEKGN